MKKKWGKLSSALLGLIMMSLMVGCGSGAEVSATAEDTSNVVMQDYEVSEETIETEEAGGDSSSIPEINTAINYNRKIIKNGTIHIQTEHFNESVNKITAYVQSLEGYIENSNIEGVDFYSKYSTSRVASLTVRVPQKSFDTFMNKGGDFGNVSYLTSNSEDITSQYVDTETRLKALNIRKDHLLALLEQSGELKDLFEIEKELGDVTYEIESLKGTLQNYDSLVDMATIQVEIEEVGEIKDNAPVKTFGDKIKATFNQSIEDVIDVLQGLLLFVIALIPFLIILIPLGIIIYIIIKKRKIRKMAQSINLNKETIIGEQQVDKEDENNK